MLWYTLRLYNGILLLLLLSRFIRVRLCATPQMAAHQAPLSLGLLSHKMSHKRNFHKRKFFSVIFFYHHFLGLP